MNRTLVCFAFMLVFGLCGHASATDADADADAGKKVFAKCAVCHSPEPGVTRVGPSLAGVVGRQSGSLPGFNYSTAMKNYGVTWNNDTLNTYLAAPMEVVKGTKMTFPGVKDETDRANVIAYLNTLK
ncbi:MAG: cytochrome c family protein [Rhodospirillales bacterium]|nr:cytochrome c family protein [Rhodospirillales bacterium]